MTINAASGVITWTPAEVQGPGNYLIGVVVTDNGIPSLSATQQLTVTVNEVNSAPTLAAFTPQTIGEGSTLTVPAVGSDSDLPANTRSYKYTSALPAPKPI